MGALDLSGVAAVLDEWIVDDVEITRDNGPSDDVLDEETGQLQEAPPTVLYADRGLIQPVGQGMSGVPDPDTQRVRQESNDRYRLILPLGAELAMQPRAGDQVRVTQVNGITQDPMLTSRRFEVDDLATVSSLPVGTFIPLKQVRIV